MTSALLEDLEWRGLIAQTTDREALLKDLNWLGISQSHLWEALLV